MRNYWSDDIDIQMYLLHYDWDFYYDEHHNIHVELNNDYFLVQREVLYKHFDRHRLLIFDQNLKEVIFVADQFKV